MSVTLGIGLTVGDRRCGEIESGFLVSPGPYVLMADLADSVPGVTLSSNSVSLLVLSKLETVYSI